MGEQGTEDHRKLVVEISGGMFGKLELLHNTHVDQFVFKIVDAADKCSYASINRKQMEHFQAKLNNYLDTMQIARRD